MTEKPRRIPRQARATTTVDAILTAALQLLEAGGVEQLTTNHVAERAGVSIGTVYQYFADKQAILSALAQRRAAAVRDGIAAMLIERPDLGTVRPIVRALMTGFEGSPATRQALLDALFHRGGEGVLQQHHEAFFARSPARRVSTSRSRRSRRSCSRTRRSVFCAPRARSPSSASIRRRSRTSSCA